MRAYFRVIDTSDLCIVQQATSCCFAALSYVWGDAEQLRLLKSNFCDLHQKSTLADLMTSIPLMIRDAIEDCKNLGLNYLWVDVLCIVQDDPEDKKLQI
jgi:Heterokaryon incompatibility protein (HET)